MVKHTVKRKSTEIAKRILDVLSKDPNSKLSIQDISKESGIAWESTKRQLELLTKLKSVKEMDVDGKKLYQRIGAVESDTLFSIPLSLEFREIIERTYGTIKEICSECDVTLSKTLIQKIAADYMEERHKEIPRGWYLYGKMLLLPYRTEEDYDKPLTEKEDIQIIRGLCQEYKPFAAKTRKIRRHQYEKTERKLYLTKEDLYYALAYYDYKDNKNKIRKFLNDFLAGMENRESEGMTMALVDDFCSSILRILRHGDDKRYNDARPAILEAFNALWNLVATCEFRASMTKFYDADLVDDYMKHKITTLEEMAQEALEGLNEYRPKIDIIEDEISEKLKELMGTGKELTPEERKKREKELQKTILSDLVRIYGLDKT